jgi:hypothetical protein
MNLSDFDGKNVFKRIMDSPWPETDNNKKVRARKDEETERENNPGELILL